MMKKIKRVIVLLLAFTLLCSLLPANVYASQGMTSENEFRTEIIATRPTNHYRLDGSRSSNVVLYVTTGDGEDGLTELKPGQEFVTSSPDTYFFVRVKDGYKAKTSFEHTYDYGNASRTDYPDWSTTKTQVSIYHVLQDMTHNPPLQSEAEERGCTYKFQYTGKENKNGSKEGNFWAQFAIKGDPFPVQLVYSIDGDTTQIADSTTYYHENVTDKEIE
jgi:hypothetical protein